MHLTREEELILSGERGEGLQKAMEILASIGDIFDAERLIDVKSVQISGVSYKTIGDAGLEFLKDFASHNAKARVFATLNPAGIDLDDENIGVPTGFVEKQREIIQTYKKLGATPSCTCTPYLAGNKPAFGEHIAWAESSAVAYANSVIGAKTNRESSITALASAITGKTPLYGLHLEENRLPTFIVDVLFDIQTTHDFSTLGYYVGKHFDGIPLFNGIRPDTEGFKALSAGLATGKISMFHVKGITPNETGETRDLERIEFAKSELKEVEEELNTCEEPDIVCIGCPHCTIKEIKQVIKANPKKEVWVYTARQNKNLINDKIKNENIKIISDTCMVVQPLEEMGIASLGTNSTKCAFYSRNLSGLDVKFDMLENLLKK
ncbi:MAG: aconitase X catalytic domain-containing protein [Candidatus Hydrothermarchaeales archaeon]